MPKILLKDTVADIFRRMDEIKEEIKAEVMESVKNKYCKGICMTCAYYEQCKGDSDMQ